MSYEVLLPDADLLQVGATGNSGKYRRIVMAVDGRDKHGKTHFSMTAPGPIVYLDFDIGTEGVADKFIAGLNGRAPKTIIKSKPFVVQPPEIAGGQKDAQAHGVAEWKRFHTTYIKALREPVIKINGKSHLARTVVVDTSSEQWELLRLAEFGKLVQVPSFLYRQVNSIMRDTVRMALDGDVNVIFLHKLENEWVKVGKDKDGNEKQAKSGVALRKGFEEMAHLVQANLFAYRRPLPDSIPVQWKYKVGLGEPDVWTAEPRNDGDLGFVVRVINSRQNPQIDGLELQDDMVDFATFAMMMLPTTVPDDWTDGV